MLRQTPNTPEQAYSNYSVAQPTLTKFGLRAGDMNFNIMNEVRKSIRVILTTYFSIHRVNKKYNDNLKNYTKSNSHPRKWCRDI
jgi:hypothetical protein